MLVRWRRLGTVVLVMVILCIGDTCAETEGRYEWGAYRPGSFLGMRTRRLPNSDLSPSPTGSHLIAGLLWHPALARMDLPGRGTIRHDVPSSDVSHFSWKVADGRGFGVQEIEDSALNLRLNVSVLSHDCQDPPGNGDGNCFGVRVNGMAMNPSRGPAKDVAVVFYIGYVGDSDDSGPIGDARGPLFRFPKGSRRRGLRSDREGVMRIECLFPGWKPSSLSVRMSRDKSRKLNVPLSYDSRIGHSRSKRAPNLELLHFMTMSSEERTNSGVERFACGPGSTYRLIARAAQVSLAKKLLDAEQLGELTRPPFAETGGKGGPIVVPAVLSDSFEGGDGIAMVQFFTSAPFEADFAFSPDDMKPLLGEALSVRLSERRASVVRRAGDVFAKTLHVESEKGVLKDVEALGALGQEALMNLVGGIGFFEGARRGSSRWYSLLTCTPSRSSFPRGFLWDEGFHLLVLDEWDPSLVRQILIHWLNSADDNGWIAREQILGCESERFVPEEFIQQHSLHANPPTLLFPVRRQMSRLAELHYSIRESGELDASAEEEEVRSFLIWVYPRLKKWYSWLEETQRTEDGLYRWRGRVGNHTLSSGLDDFPRTNNATAPPSESERHVDLLSWMILFSKTLKELQSVLGLEVTFAGEYDRQVALLSKHWNGEVFCDLVDGSFVDHVGYISFFPFFLGLVDGESPFVASLLKALIDRDIMWSPFGLRSLSVSDPLFGTGENYWRGPIWVPLNYLALSALRGSKLPLGHKAYERLRAHLLTNLKRQWQSTGFLWEQYDGETGKGQRGRAFTGWTSLFAEILVEKYI